MSVVEELIRTEEDGALSFGNHELPRKAKVEDYECAGNLYKVKTFYEMTKLERDGMFVYESVPGTSVSEFKASAKGVEFSVCGAEDAQITIGLKEDTEYEVFVSEKSVGKMKTNLGGKLNISVELAGEGEIPVRIVE
ncbi:MAG TPA: endosialidase [Lachnospiraceae bacterium]|nr:endosialidase [Lachnospiraceae bacterium]